MFVGDEVLLDLSYLAARTRLADLALSGLLRSASDDAYSQEIASLVAVGPLGAVPVVSRLAEVHFAEFPGRRAGAGMAMRWQAIAPDGALTAVLDADISLAPSGDHAAMLTIAGAYRPPLSTAGAEFDRAVVQKVASATVRNFLARLADAILSPPADGQGEPGRGLPREPQA